MRSLGGVLLALLATLAIAGAGTSASAIPPQSPVANAMADCPTVLVLGVRGSGDAKTNKGGMSAAGFAFYRELQRNARFVGGTYIDYPAVSVFEKNWRKILNGVGAGLKLGFLGAYHDSVVEGKRALRARLVKAGQECGTFTRIVLTGHSQGAQVIGDVIQGQSSKPLPERVLKQIIGVALFGDPYFNGKDGLSGQFTYPRALQSSGALGRRKPYGARWRGAILSYCHATDPVCQSDGFRFSAHTNYASGPEPKQAATYFGAILSRGMQPPIQGFRLPPLVAKGIAQPQAAECSFFNGELSCWWLGNLPAGAKCDFGGTVPTVVLSATRPARQSFVCMDEGFHNWLPLDPQRTWAVGAISCTNSLEDSGGSQRGVLRCGAGKHGFSVTGDGRLNLY